MRVLTVDSGVASPGAVATKANAEAVINGVTDLAAPHALLRVASALLGDMVTNGGADLLDPRIREGRGDVEGGVDVTLQASESVGLGKAAQTPIEGLSLYL